MHYRATTSHFPTHIYTTLSKILARFPISAEEERSFHMLRQIDSMISSSLSILIQPINNCLKQSILSKNRKGTNGKSYGVKWEWCRKLLELYILDFRVGFSYLCPSWRSSPSPRWNASGTHRAPSWEPVPPAVGCGRWFGPDTNLVSHSAAPTAPPSGLEGRAHNLYYSMISSKNLSFSRLSSHKNEMHCSFKG